MAPAGLAAWERRDASGIDAYSFEQKPTRLPPDCERTFRTERAAWAYFQRQPSGYRRVMYHWITSAKRDATRLSRLAILMECSADKRRVDSLSPRGAQRKPTAPTD
jgi:uncharacterized protein YdeI (YjbR/CyaY-like superfamily)